MKLTEVRFPRYVPPELKDKPIEQIEGAKKQLALSLTMAEISNHLGAKPITAHPTSARPATPKAEKPAKGPPPAPKAEKPEKAPAATPKTEKAAPAAPKTEKPEKVAV